jgi:HSP20 family protein
VNVAEDAENVYLEALAPGLDAEKLDISVVRNQITISGEKAPVTENVAQEKVHRAERASGRFVRTFTLPSEIDDAKVSAEYKAGILRVTLPKSEAAKPKKIAVSVA